MNYPSDLKLCRHKWEKGVMEQRSVLSGEILLRLRSELATKQIRNRFMLRHKTKEYGLHCPVERMSMGKKNREIDKVELQWEKKEESANELKREKKDTTASLPGQWGLTHVTWGNYGGFHSCLQGFSPARILLSDKRSKTVQHQSPDLQV